MSAQNSIRSPLQKARGLGSAKEGFHHWWVQRITAVAMIPLSLYFLYSIDVFVTGNLAGVLAWITTPLNSIATILFVVASFYHGALGVQVIVEDYVHHEGCKIALLLLNKLTFIALGVTAIFAVIAINFGFYR